MNMCKRSFSQRRLSLFFWLSFLSIALSGRSEAAPTPAKSAEIPKPSASNQVTIQYAKGFTISYKGRYKIVSIINPFEKTVDTIRYVLVPRGTVAPKGFARSQVIETPIRSLVAMSSTHVALTGFLGVEDLLVGLGNLQYVSSPKVIQRIEAGKVREIGRNQSINEELLVSMHPDLVMTMGSPTSRMDRYTILNGAGIPVLINSDYIETTPLGRAEWVKLLAALLNKESLANQKFTQVEQEYKRLTNLAKQTPNKPTILSGMNSKDAWFVPDADSYMTRFFQDAGSNYPWATRRTTGSLPLNFEAVYPVALKADYWLNVGMMSVDTKQQVLAKDARYADFKAFKSGKIYTYNKRVNSRGSNDFWESATVNPQLVLADLIKILHPELLPKHELVYYTQLK
ncbi:ABC transporter substrate-binding protein [Spirosoma daeguense]